MMTLMQERAIDLIKRMSDEKIYYLINLLDDYKEPKPLYGCEKTEAQKSYQNLQKYRHEGAAEIDYKAALHTAWEEKYEDLN